MKLYALHYGSLFIFNFGFSNDYFNLLLSFVVGLSHTNSVITSFARKTTFPENTAMNSLPLEVEIL